MRILSLALALLPIAGLAEIREWRIDTSHSAAHFSVRHMMVSNVRGQLGNITGTVKYDPADPVTAVVNARIEASTIDTRQAKRDAHLRNPDFLDVEKFPAITFQSKRVEAVQPGSLKIIGDLTIRDVTREVTLLVDGPSAPLAAGRGGMRSGATATTTISRKNFGITWNRAMETGGAVVGDEVKITVDIEFVEDKPTS